MSWTVVWEERALVELRRLRLLDPAGAKACVMASRTLGDEPKPEAASALGGSGYYRLSVGCWRVLYQVEDDTVYVMNVGRTI
ncbi:type II toxin-antitoxin system RelE/ParE family toxin [Streptomyces rectiverticillatus]|uniref:type II toxin-antitoxin system RelE family toxin n=1 Tax=Streptomyces rectiverticillatus TaxID=173860 RepID=UPI0015C30B0A|nr:type II toxin-antitoxin system RelE/ParE family toxin [Streptomyces rectiverticillatus]QLE73657.1 type II toxin-antitoxin system RelE/ParE family toxin [Streptomyces rectiverticillatus]